MSDQGDYAESSENSGSEARGKEKDNVRRVRISHPLWKDLRVAAATLDTTPAELLREGARYVLFGTEPRHGHALKRGG